MLFVCACASESAAQLSGTLSAVSDYRYRGATLSDRMPAAQAGIAYDDPLGWYAGAFGSTVKLQPPQRPSAYLQSIVYAGYAARLSPGFNVEVGGDYSAFAGAGDLNYGEVFLGASTSSLNARVYYASHYFGVSSSVYAEISAAQPLLERVQLHLHLGWLRYRYDSTYALYVQPVQRAVDARVGLRVELDPFQLEIAWVGVSNHTAAYPFTGSRSPNGVVAALSLSF